MAYINAQEVAAIRKELKTQLPELKFSVKKGAGSSSVQVTILSGNIDFSEILQADAWGHPDHADINHHWLDRYGRFQPLFEKILKIIKTAPATSGVGREWFDESDSMTDYFHTAYYINMRIGHWDKGYKFQK